MSPPSLGWLFSFHILFQLLSFADAQFNIGLYPTSDCSPFSPGALFCRGYRSLQCCERPPGSEVFIAAQVTSGGPPGITCYHNPTSFGTCWTLDHTNPINSCDRNVPFKPITVLGIDDINNAKSNGDITYQQIGSIDMGDFLPLPFSPRDVASGEESAPATNTTQCGKTNALTFPNSRTVFRMTEDHHTEAFMHEFMNQTEAYMVEKYNLEIDPATYDPTFWGASWDEVKDLPVFGQDNANGASTNSAAPAPSARQQSRTSQVSVSSVGVKESVAPASAGVQSSQGRESAALWQDGQSTTLARLVSQANSASAEQSKSS